MVMPERETPGINAVACARPTTTASRIVKAVIELRVRSPGA